MTGVDWLKVVGWYAAGVAMAQVAAVAIGRASFGGPSSAGALLVPALLAANMVFRLHGRALPRRLLAVTIAVIAVLQVVTLAVGQATVGWEGGWKDNAVFAAFPALVYPLGVAWLHRRDARTVGPATDPGARKAV